LKPHLCICGRGVSDRSHELKLLEELQKQITVSSEVAQDIDENAAIVDHLLRQISNFDSNMQGCK
jgi:hypothetical protein